ncbi:MAG: molybdate ABC transporter permease subunit [Coriobacteriales bacterium]|nr:molybdate ABC transporter permease subunit [Coriobacteriales bacterium]
MAICLLLLPSLVAGAAFAAGADEDAAAADVPDVADVPGAVGVPEVSRTGTEARLEGSSFALSGFMRLNKGTGKEYEGRSFGYRYQMASQDAFAVVVRDERNVLVYLPVRDGAALEGAAARAGFEAMLAALDAQMSNGGVMLADTDRAYEYTSERSVRRDGYRYDFAVEVEPGYWYTTVTGEGAADDSAGALFGETGRIVDAGSVSIEEAPTGLAAFGEFLFSLDLRPFWVSLRTSAVAMLFVFVLGLLAAWYSQRISTRLKGVLDSVLTIPLVLPPTVCGFLLLVLFGNSTPVGRWLLGHGIELIFSWPAAVLAAVVVSFPLMYRTARGAFEGLDPSLGDAARTLGWSERRIFLSLTMPLSWPSIAAGTVLAFARAMGEFGATLFVAGNYPGVTQTMPIAIYFEWMGGHSDVATFWVLVVILFSFVVILFVNWYASHTQRYRRAGSDVEDGGLPPFASGAGGSGAAGAGGGGGTSGTPSPTGAAGAGGAAGGGIGSGGGL